MDQIIKKIRKDEYERNRFIEKYKPFLAHITSSICHKYVTYGVDEELSIALLAFNESIDRYSGEGLFFEFAKLVVRSRLIDYYKSKEYQEKQRNDSLENYDYILDYSSNTNYNEQLRKQRLKEEVEILAKELKIYNIEFEDLYNNSPKHKIKRNQINELTKQFIKDPFIVGTVIDKGQLPITFIVNNYKTTRKRIEPYRKYIMTIIIMVNGQFELLYDYLPEGMVK